MRPGAKTTGSSSRRALRGPSCRFRPREGRSRRPRLWTRAREGTHRWPWFLPDGRHFLYYAAGSTGQEPGEIVVGEVGSGKVKHVVQSSSIAVYAYPGYLLFVRGSSLVAQAFDADRLEVHGDATPLGVDLPLEFVDERPAGHLRFSRRNDLLARSSELDEPAGGARSPGTRDRKARGGRDLVLPSSLSGRSAAGRGARSGRHHRRGHLDDRHRSERGDAHDSGPGGRPEPDLVARRVRGSSSTPDRKGASATFTSCGPTSRAAKSSFSRPKTRRPPNRGRRTAAR